MTPVAGLGAVILCGGQSSRMKFPKHELWFDGKTFLQSVVDSVSQVAEIVVAVAAHGERPPSSLPSNVQLLNDERLGLGPLEGIRTALATLENQVSHAFVTSCDVPKLCPQLIRKLVELIDDHDAVVPIDGSRVYGMTAIYKTAMHSKIDEIYASGASRRVSALQAILGARCVRIEDLKIVDPELASFENVNTVEQYTDLLKRSGLVCPKELHVRLANVNARH